MVKTYRISLRNPFDYEDSRTVIKSLIEIGCLLQSIKIGLENDLDISALVTSYEEAVKRKNESIIGIILETYPDVDYQNIIRYDVTSYTDDELVIHTCICKDRQMEEI